MYQKINSATDLGIKPGAGLKPPSVPLEELYEDFYGMTCTLVTSYNLNSS